VLFSSFLDAVVLTSINLRPLNKQKIQGKIYFFGFIKAKKIYFFGFYKAKKIYFSLYFLKATEEMRDSESLIPKSVLRNRGPESAPKHYGPGTL
jgi:hypothetical protein